MDIATPQSVSVMPIQEALTRYVYMLDELCALPEGRSIILNRTQFKELEDSKAGNVHWDGSIIFLNVQCFRSSKATSFLPTLSL